MKRTFERRRSTSAPAVRYRSSACSNEHLGIPSVMMGLRTARRQSPRAQREVSPAEFLQRDRGNCGLSGNSRPGRLMWGGQSWLPPAFQPALVGCEDSRIIRRSRLKGGCRQDCLSTTTHCPLRISSSRFFKYSSYSFFNAGSFGVLYDLARLILTRANILRVHSSCM